jgi:hypothetical protein
MAENQAAAGPSPVVHSREGQVKGLVQGLGRMLDETRDRALTAFLEEVLKERDKEWISVTDRTVDIFKKMGMFEAAKLVCPVCATGKPPLRRPADDKTAASWTHHPEKDGQPDKTIGTVCLAAVIHETLEAKK